MSDDPTPAPGAGAVPVTRNEAMLVAAALRHYRSALESAATDLSLIGGQDIESGPTVSVLVSLLSRFQRASVLGQAVPAGAARA